MQNLRCCHLHADAKKFLFCAYFKRGEKNAVQRSKRYKRILKNEAKMFFEHQGCKQDLEIVGHGVALRRRDGDVHGVLFGRAERLLRSADSSK